MDAPENDRHPARSRDALGCRRVLAGGAGLAVATLVAAWCCDVVDPVLTGAAPAPARPAVGAGTAPACRDGSRIKAPACAGAGGSAQGPGRTPAPGLRG